MFLLLTLYIKIYLHIQYVICFLLERFVLIYSVWYIGYGILLLVQQQNKYMVYHIVKKSKRR